jgi:hypothetical protein
MTIQIERNTTVLSKYRVNQSKSEKKNPTALKGSDRGPAQIELGGRLEQIYDFLELSTRGRVRASF